MRFKVNHNKNGEPFISMIDKPTDIIFDLENKLILANKRVKKLEARVEQQDMLELRKKFEIAKLKQKKAWIAFYIATIIYIVGIIIFIWK